MKPGKRVGGLILAVLTGMLIAGCGGDDEEEAATPEDVVSAFFEATVNRDAAGVCETITVESADAAAANEDAETCEEGAEITFASEAAEAEIAQFEAAEIGAATIDGDTATVSVTSEGQEAGLPVVKEDGEWKVNLEAGP